MLIAYKIFMPHCFTHTFFFSLAQHNSYEPKIRRRSNPEREEEKTSKGMFHLITHCLAHMIFMLQIKFCRHVVQSNYFDTVASAYARFSTQAAR